MSADDSLGRTILLVGAAVLLVAVLLPLLVMVLAMPMMGLGFGHAGTWNGTMGSAWPWLVAWAVHLGLVLAIGYVLYRALRGSTGRRTDPALEELRTAYARGDLSSEEFEERRERLERGERR
ncbi:SHOCT domain-containing protein [Natronorubrum sp. DTA28]|uniref:SHOCT domain-containing protein n=1 Tax=Natronorubrum sp. DTA28 TaxID=3447019 RepID=UPI003F8516DE